MDDEIEARHFFTITCSRCARKLQLLSTSREDLLDRLTASEWEMQPSAPMADPIEDGEPFLCTTCKSR